LGYKRHHSIIVTGYGDSIVKARNEALEIFKELQVSPLIKSIINNYLTLFVAPDGSKEDWEESEQGDIQRKLFVDWLNSQKYEDGSGPLDWVEVQYGDDNGVTKIINDSENIK
jgi:hypothetical protein